MIFENLPIYFGDFLKKKRLQNGFSQESLANLTGLDRTYISLLERGKRNPTLKTFFILADAFQVPAGDMLQEIINICRSYENSPD